MKVEEMFAEIKSATSKCDFLIKKAIEQKPACQLTAEALLAIKANFASLGGITKRSLNNHLVQIVDAMMPKLIKDKAFLLSLAENGVKGSDILVWVNQRLGL